MLSLLQLVGILSMLLRFNGGFSLSAKRASSASILQRSFENDLLDRGFKYIIGCDEAGRGPLAGPVVVTSLIVKPNAALIKNAMDSKKLSERVREEIYGEIMSDSNRENYIVHTEIIDHDVIDKLNILQATLLGMQTSVNKVCEGLEKSGCYALIDGNKLPSNVMCSSRAIVRGDALVYPIALASIVSKVTRDRIMTDMDALYPE